MEENWKKMFKSFYLDNQNSGFGCQHWLLKDTQSFNNRGIKFLKPHYIVFPTKNPFNIHKEFISFDVISPFDVTTDFALWEQTPHILA